MIHLEFEQTRKENLDLLDRIEARDFDEPRDLDADREEQARRDEAPPRPRIRYPGGPCEW